LVYSFKEFAMKNRFALVAVAGTVALLTLVGCNQNQKQSAAASDKSATLVNTTCPYTGGPVKSTVTSEYKGQMVGFCCPGCQGRWAKASDAEKDAMLAKAK
jgi:hypothetical protein